MGIFRKLFATFPDKYLEQLWHELNHRLLGSFDVISLGMDAVASMAALATVDGDLLADGVSKRVLTLQADFVLEKASAAPVDGITSIAAVGGGRWLRQAPTSPDRTWLDRTAWYIDPAAGNDEAAGLLATPLKTWAELRRRVGTTWRIDHDVEVVWLGPNDASDAMQLDAICTTTGTLKIHGVRTTLFAGVTTAFDAHPALSNTENKLTAAGGFAPAAHDLIEFTSGPAAGANCWVAKDLGAGVARVSYVLSGGSSFDVSPSIAAPTPGGGDDFRVVGLTSIVVSSIDARGMKDTNGVQIYDLDLVSVNFIQVAGQFLGLVVTANCRLDYTAAYRSLFVNVCVPNPGLIQLNESANNLYGGLIAGDFIVYYQANVRVRNVGITFQGTFAQVGFSSTLALEKSSGFYDSAYSGIVLQKGSLVSVSEELYGSGNTNFGVLIYGPNATLAWDTVPTATGGDGNYQIGNVTHTWAQSPYFDARTGSYAGKSFTPFYVATASYANTDTARAAGAVTNTGAAQFLLPNSTEQANAVPGTTVPNLGHVVVANGFVRNLRIHANAAPGGALNCPVVVWHVPIATGVPVLSGLAASLGPAEKDKSDTAHSLWVVPGDLLVVGHTNPAGSLVTNLSAAFEIS